MMRIDLTLDTAMDVDSLINGSFKPLKTFMGRKEIDSVLKAYRLPNGEPWPIPILFPISDKTKIQKGQKINLYYNNIRYAQIIVDEIFHYDTKKLCKLCFGTLNKNHPGVRKTLNGSKRFISGKLSRFTKLRQLLNIDALEPKEVLSIIKKRRWKHVVAFHTRNPPHRAHEFLQKAALQTHDGLFLHPIIGSKKPGDFTSEAILKGYRQYIKHYLPKKQVILTPLLSYSRYAGPREALFTAIVRRNFGCTSFIVGRDHTGVGKFYDPLESHRIFEKFNDLSICPLCFLGPYYCLECKEVTTRKTCGHGKKDIKEISGTTIRDGLRRNKAIRSEIIRPEVLSVLKSMKKPFV